MGAWEGDRYLLLLELLVSEVLASSGHLSSL